MHRARSVEEYVDWVTQAIDEVVELRACLDYEADFPGHIPQFLDPLEQMIRDLYKSMEDGTYRFGNEDLPFIELANKHLFEIPFMSLLESVNETHQKGLDAHPE